MSRRILAARIAPSANVTPPPPPGMVGKKFAWPFAISGIAQPYRYKIAGTLPPGVDWYPAARLLQGIPTTRGNYPITITVLGADRIPIVFPFEIEVADAPMSLVGAFEADIVGTSLKGSLTVFGGTGPFVLEGVDGSPPPGITFAMAAGVITASGVTTQAGIWQWNFRIHDAAGAFARIPYTVTTGNASTSFHYVFKSGDHAVAKTGDHFVTHAIPTGDETHTED